MTCRILICGLPTSGKTTFTTELAKQLGNITVLNGDEVRAKYNDWDFSSEGRLRQAQRMVELSTNATTEYVLIDFVCPLNGMRRMVGADWTIWMDTIDEGPYENTNRMFETPDVYDFRIVEKATDMYCSIVESIIRSIKQDKRSPIFDPTKPSVQMLGRWQPWHAGHQALFDRALQKTGQVAIMVRSMPLSDQNPFPFEAVKLRIERALDSRGYKGKYCVISVPNIVNITYGRDVGYTITEEVLGDDIHAISATRIREALRGFEKRC